MFAIQPHTRKFVAASSGSALILDQRAYLINIKMLNRRCNSMDKYTLQGLLCRIGWISCGDMSCAVDI